MNNELDWRLLRVFLAVANTGTLTAAAQVLGSSQPTVGRQLTQLEAQLGAPLVVRHSRGIALTVHGSQLWEVAKRVDAQMQAVVRQAQGNQGRLEGTVRISATEMVGVYILMPALARLRAAYPGIALELVLDSGAADLATSQADIAVRMFRPAGQDLVARRVGFIATALFASRDYAARRGLPEALEDLVEHDLVGFDRNQLILRAMAQAVPGLSREALSLRTDSMLAQLEAVRQGAGLGALQVEIARRYPELVRALPGTLLSKLGMWLVTHQDVRGGAHIRAVFDALGEELTAYSAALGTLLDDASA